MKILKVSLIIIVIITIIGVIAINIFNKNYEEKMNNLVINNIDLTTVKDGTYKGDYSIFPIEVEVEVTVKDNIITNIDLIKHVTGQGQKASSIIDVVVDKQSLQVDTVSGATGSSKVILKAIENALKEN